MSGPNENQPILKNMTLPENYYMEQKSKIRLKAIEATPGQKKLWLEEIIVSCDVICGADGKKGVVCLPSCRAYAFDEKGS